ncbi:MAG: enoyl-CoA hydratase-related protein [Solirubrobacteraceae bacterium]|nr:enoyl-CoA hydratase-related protein [Patulibacter sp.]
MLSLDDRGIATLPVATSMTAEWLRQFRDDATALATLDGVRVVVLAAEGRFFNLGGDLPSMAQTEDPGAVLRELAGTLHEGVLALSTVGVPVIARVQGPAAGAGMSLVLGADLAIASESASLTMAYTGVGLSPDGGASWLLPRIVGARRASELILTNRTLTAAEALDLGILTQVVPADELDDAVDALAAKLAAGPTASYAASKRLLSTSPDNDLATQLALEGESIAAMAASPTGREGVAAFLERRPATFPAR